MPLSGYRLPTERKRNYTFHPVKRNRILILRPQSSTFIMPAGQKREISGQHDDHPERRPQPPTAGTGGTPKTVPPSPDIRPASIGMFGDSSKPWTDVGDESTLPVRMKEVEKEFAAQPADTSEGNTSVPSARTSPLFTIPASTSPSGVREPKPTTGAYNFAVEQSAVAGIDDESALPEKVKEVERDLADINRELGYCSIEIDDIDTAQEAMGKTTKSLAVIQEARRKYGQEKDIMVRLDSLNLARYADTAFRRYRSLECTETLIRASEYSRVRQTSKST